MNESNNIVNMVIRPARLEDAQVIADYNNGIAEETEDKSLDMTTLLAGVKQILSRSELGRYYVAVVGEGDDEEVIGQLMITFEWSDWRNGLFWWIQSVYVHSEYRRQGVFRALYEHVREEAKGEAGVCGLRLYVEHENKRAQNSYVNMGMKGAGYEIFEEDWS